MNPTIKCVNWLTTLLENIFNWISDCFPYSWWSSEHTNRHSHIKSRYEWRGYSTYKHTYYKAHIGYDTLHPRGYMYYQKIKEQPFNSIFYFDPSLLLNSTNLELELNKIDQEINDLANYVKKRRRSSQGWVYIDPNSINDFEQFQQSHRILWGSNHPRWSINRSNPLYSRNSYMGFTNHDLIRYERILLNEISDNLRKNLHMGRYQRGAFFR